MINLQAQIQAPHGVCMDHVTTHAWWIHARSKEFNLILQQFLMNNFQAYKIFFSQIVPPSFFLFVESPCNFELAYFTPTHLIPF